MPDHQFELQLKVLDHIQTIIQRLAGNSFLIKGWAVTVASALIGLAVKDSTSLRLIYISMLPTIIFWMLDSYYLALERAYREAYRLAGDPRSEVIAGVSASPITWIQLMSAAFSPATVLPYLALLISAVLVGIGLFSWIVPPPLINH